MKKPICAVTVLVVAPALATPTYAGPLTGACCNLGDCTIETEVDCLTAGGSYQGNNTACSKCSQGNCLQDAANCQEPNIGQFPGGFILTPYETADNFVATVTGNITSICFWGAYISGNADCDLTVSGDSITVTFYQNILTIPPAPNISLFPTVITATVVASRDTGQDFILNGFPQTVNEYEFTATLDVPFPVTAGECIWIQIENAVSSTDSNCLFFWEVSPEFVIDPILGNGDDLAWNIPNDISIDFDMAFCVNQAMGDVTSCALPLLGECVLNVPAGSGRCIIGAICAVVTEASCSAGGGVYTADIDCRESCNNPNPFVTPSGGFIGGCSDPACCTLVCTELPLCCLTFPTGWDGACVDAALNIGCVGSPLCGGTAEVSEESCQRFSSVGTTISTFDPLDPLNDQYTCADDFTPAADGAVSIICWQGLILPVDLANVPANNFTVTYYDDVNGFPATVIGGPFSQGGGSLTNVTDVDTNVDLNNVDIREYTAEHTPVPVAAGECYWIEIKNGVGGDMDAMGNATTWFWQWASEAGTTAPFYSGNGRSLIDGTPPDGYDINDYAGARDLAICFKDLGPLQVPTCGLDTLYLSGPEEPVCGRIIVGGGACGPPEAVPHEFVGYASGCLDINGDGNCIGDGYEQRRAAQPFTLPDGNWHVSQLFVFGFVPAGVTNEDMNFQVFSRTGMDQPRLADTLVVGSIPFGKTTTQQSNPQGRGAARALHSIATDFNLPGGDYYLTVWASNSPPMGTCIVQHSEFAWYANADTPPELNNICTLACIGPTPEDLAAGNIGCDGTDCASTVGKATMWRSRHWPPLPDGFGFGQYGIPGLIPDNTTFDDLGDPDPDPADLYNASMFVRGGTTTSVCGNSIIEPGETCDPPGPGCSAICQTGAPPCPWDCGGDNDQNVGIVDFLAMLSQWSQIGTSCDIDGCGVGIVDFLALLANWGPCP